MAVTRIVNAEMKSKVNDTDYEILHPITTTGNVKTSTDIEVMLPEAIGSYAPGDTITAGTNVDDIVKKLLQVQIPPTYTEPKIAIAATGNAGGSYEVGTSVTPTIKSTFTANDAGAITNHQILKDGVEVTSGTNAEVSHVETFTIGTTSVVFKSTASYNAGAIKNDNFGEPYPSTSVKAGSKTSSNITYTGYRTYFYGTGTGNAAPTTSDEIRALTKGTSAASNGKTFTISMPAGQQMAVFAYPGTLRDVTSVKYVEAGNDESKGLFTKTTVSVEGANGFEAVDYKVYTLALAQPSVAAMTFNVTI